MAGVNKRHQKNMRKTKAQLVEELEALERELAEAKRGKGGAEDTATIALRESEKQLRAVVENAPAAILLKDTDGRYLMANPKWHEWFNPKGEDISGKTVYDFYTDEHAKKVSAHDREVVKTGEAVTKEHTAILTDGKEIIRTLHKFPIRDADGSIVAIGAISIDISERKQAEEALRQSEARLHEAIQSLQQAFALYDADDRLVAFNDEYARLRPGAQEILEKGGTFEDMIRANVEREIIPEAYGREEEFIEERIEEHLNPKGTIIRRFKDGTWSRIEEVRTPTGGIALSFIDITDLKQAEEALAKSEALFRAVVNNSPTKIHIKDVDGRYTLINKEAEKLFGITDEEGRGKTSYDLFPKKEADAFMAHDKEVIESGQSREEEEEFVLDDGLHTFLTVKFPIYDQHGVSGVGAIGTDITERKRAERALMDNQARFRDFAQVASDWFWEMGPDLRFTYFSERFTEITGFPVKDRIGTRRNDHVPKNLSKAEQANWDAHFADLEGKRPFRNFEYATTATSRGLRYVSVSGEPKFDDAAGAFLGYRGTGTDITERKRAEEALKKAKEQAEYASRTKTEFLANMSHELRTPLNSILGFSEVLMREILGPHGNPKYREYAEDIHYSGSHLLRLINEVLDLSKLEAGEISIVEDEFDVAAAIGTCIKMIEGRYAEKESPFNAQVPADLPAMLGDELRFKQILLNLIGNAAKFTPPDGDITVSAEVSKEGRIVVRVEDTGVGIAAADIPKVLEPFGQVHDVMTRDHEGSGLGLHLAKSFTEMHGGVLEIESTPGKGTTVILTFPKERTAPTRQKKRA